MLTPSKEEEEEEEGNREWSSKVSVVPCLDMLRRAAGDAWGKKSRRDVARKEKAKMRNGAWKGMIKARLMRRCLRSRG